MTVLADMPLLHEVPTVRRYFSRLWSEAARQVRPGLQRIDVLPAQCYIKSRSADLGPSRQNQVRLRRDQDDGHSVRHENVIELGDK